MSAFSFSKRDAWLGVIASLALSSAAQAAPSSRELAIVRGSGDDRHDSVIGLVDANGRLYCSAVLVAPRIAVTAAHCIAPVAERQMYIFVPSAGGIGQLTEVVESRRHPLYVPESVTYDVGVVLLEGDVQGVRPASLKRDWMPVFDATVQLVGWGDDRDASTARQDWARKQASGVVTSPIAPVTVIGTTGAACHADSGGGLFPAEAPDTLIGVISSGDSECAGTAFIVSASSIGPLLDGFPDPSVELGDACMSDEACVSGFCAPQISSAAHRFCSLRCDTHRDCDSDTACAITELGDRLCVPPVLPGANGAQCRVDADCKVGRCATFGGDEESVCALLCDPDSEPACPAGFECIPSSSGEPACRPAGRSPVNGCSARQSGTAGAQWTGLAVLVACAAYYRRRVRPRQAGSIAGGDRARVRRGLAGT